MRWIKFAHGIVQIVLRMNQQKYMKKSKFIIRMKLNKNIQIQLIQLQAHVSAYFLGTSGIKHLNNMFHLPSCSYVLPVDHHFFLYSKSHTLGRSLTQ